MLKYLKTLAVALSLAIIPPWAQAAVVTNTTDQLFNAVDEISTTLIVPAGTVLTTFVSGTYAVENVVQLQREVGSPGSGTWEDVQAATGEATVANARVTIPWTTGTGTEGYRLIMTATGTGAVVAYLTDHPVAARAWATDSAQITYWDEFTGDSNDGSLTVVNPSLYLVHDSDSGGGTVGAVDTAIQEGAVILNGGSTADNGSCMSAIAAATKGALVSDGWTVFEARLRSGALDGKIAMLLTTSACVSDTVPVVDIDSGVVSQIDAGTESLAGFVRQDEATDVDAWQAISAIADAEGANALEVVLDNITTAVNTYVVLRIEVDSAGNAYWYIAGTLVHAEPLAVTTTARLIPAIFVMETALNVGAVIVFVDYWLTVVPRPIG